jgi:hypothetical protein
MLVDLKQPRKLVDSIPFIYGHLRSKWISEQEFVAIFEIVKNSLRGDRFIFYDGKPSNLFGHIFNVKSLIKKAIIFTNEISTFDIKLLIDDAIVNTTTVSNNNKKEILLNESVDMYSKLSCKFLSSGPLNNIHVSITYSYTM